MESCQRAPMSTQTELKIEHYILGKTIGMGGFGKVKIARHEYTGNNVAVKIINKKRMKDRNMGSRIKREIKLLRYFNHPNIIRLYEVLETQTDVFLVMEYAPRGEIFELIAHKGKLDEHEARFFFRQIVAGVEYCHSNLVAHRDLKPENILVDEYKTIKIADFGLSNLMKDGKFMKTDCGSPNYAAPEVISKKKYIGTEADTWSCGVILFALLAGYLPFDEEVLQMLFKKIKEGDYEIPEHFSKEAADLIRRMLQPNPILRLKFHELKLHPWLRTTYMLYLDPRQIRFYLNPLKINQELFEKLKVMEFDFKGLDEERVKDTIKKRKDYSFVIGYNLMFDEAVKKQVMAEILHKQEEYMERKKTLKQLKASQQSLSGCDGNLTLDDNCELLGTPKHILEDVKDTIQVIQNEFVPIRKKTMIEISSDYDGWHYGLRYKYPPKLLMACAVDTLLELNTTYMIKSSNFKIKCFHHIYRDFPAFSPENPFKQINGVYVNRDVNYPKFNMPPPQPSQEKFPKDELAFNLKVYTLSKEDDEYVVDVQRTRGHSIVFLNYCQKFVQLLHKNLIQKGYKDTLCPFPRISS